MEDVLQIRGARQHNLKNISLDIPKNKLIVFTGVSGSGKSSLAFDTIYAEGQRRYVESLSSYARQFLGIMDKPDVDQIRGLSPAISIDQKSTSHNPRSTVGTVTEIYDYLRLLFARIGHPHCPTCGNEITKRSVDEIVTMILSEAKLTLATSGKKILFFLLLSPVVRDRKGEFSGLFTNLKAKGYQYIRIDGQVMDISNDMTLIKTNRHSVDVVIDRLSFMNSTFKNDEQVKIMKKRITDAVEQSIHLSEGLVTVGHVLDEGFVIPEKPKKIKDTTYSEHLSCPICNKSLPEIEPRTFSFNSPHGACPTCTGIGHITSVDPDLVLRPELTISEGGIVPFAKMFFHDTWYARVVSTVCTTHSIDQKIPIKYLTPEQIHILLYGTDNQMYEVEGKNRFGDTTRIVEPYRGIVNELKRRYTETQSGYVRTEIERYMRDELCPTCQGKRLKAESLTITITDKSIADITKLSIVEMKQFVDLLSADKNNTLLNKRETIIASSILKEIKTRLSFLVDVGLTYLSLDRNAGSLSGGEAQRIRLASQIGSGLSGVLYVLDEPSIGLHQRDNQKLIDTLFHLRDLGNTVIVVEHDRDMIRECDTIVDFGPGAGENGGSILFQGTPKEIETDSKSITGKYLSGKKTISRQLTRVFREKESKKLTLVDAMENNLKNITVDFPLGKFICVTGVSGSGKSTLIVDTLWAALANHTNPLSKAKAGKHKEIQGLDAIDKSILIDQSPIGRTPRSNPATYTGVFTFIRDLFSQLAESKERGFTAGRFSFNIKGGRCEACEGDGQKKIEMQFLSDVFVTCDVCHGLRYNSETLEVQYRGKSIADILGSTIEEAKIIFASHTNILHILQTLCDVGLGYMKLGQSATTLSGGEAQRVKLATELVKRSTGKTIYILDEPTTGLHFADLEKLLHVLHRLTASGNTVIVIEHNLDIIKNADYIIDLGPEGGDQGGYVIACGSPKDIANSKTSYTGQCLKSVL